MRWAEMTVVCASEAVDAVSYAFIQVGCGGVMIVGDGPSRVQGSLPVTDELMARIHGLKDHLDRLPEFGLPGLLDGLTLRYAEDEDWANAWKQYFKPLHIGRHLVIKPSWEEYDREKDDVVIELDPGMAFGTGGHPTTQLCLQAMEDHVRPGIVMADVGTGSGILAIAGARLGAAMVHATDIDPLARRIAEENFGLNGLREQIQVLKLEAFDAQTAGYDLVVANIVARTIIEMAPAIAPRIHPDGLFIGSGIVEDQEIPVREALEAAGLEVIDARREDIWVSLVARRTAIREANAPLWSASIPPLPEKEHDWRA